MALDAPWLPRAIDDLRGEPGGLDGYPEGASGTPLCPFRAGSAVMESLNLGRIRKSRVAAGYERRLRRSNGDSRGRQRVITRIITKMFTREHRHFFDLPVFR